MFSASYKTIQMHSTKIFFPHDILWLKLFFLVSQHSEEIYDTEIYRQQIAEYYNPYGLDPDIQPGEFCFDIAVHLMWTVL